MNGKLCTRTEQKKQAESLGHSLFPICSKIFERLINNKMFTFFTENNLISPNQSGFRPGVSCVNTLLAIYPQNI